MSSTVPEVPAPSRVLCLGEALVELICNRPFSDISSAEVFVPRFGGAVANVAVVAARCGAAVALAGGAGEDEWGRWLHARLVREGVDTSMFRLIPGVRTPLAMVAIGSAGEPTRQLYGDTIPTVVRAFEDGGAAAVTAAVAASGGLLISSDTLVGPEERELTMHARSVALEHDRAVVFDPNLRMHRWRSRADAAATANACVPGALLVRVNAADAALMTGEDDPERAAVALLKAGARMVVVTLGPRGAILRGAMRADAAGVRTPVLSTAGAGDVLTGILLAKLAVSGYYPPAVAAALPEAVRESARACQRWGALD